jgi:hypothetical protein
MISYSMRNKYRLFGVILQGGGRQAVSLDTIARKLAITRDERSWGDLDALRNGRRGSTSSP